MWTISKGRNRKGFTLIELMIVIAIIIILAAIAIPNYLKMTERARKASIESDLKSVATALETYSTDWGGYPVASSAESLYDSGTDVFKELTGGLAAGSGTNNSDNTTTTGEKGPIQYIIKNALLSISKTVGTDGSCDYTSDGSTYTITATAKLGGKTWKFTCEPGGVITISQS